MGLCGIDKINILVYVKVIASCVVTLLLSTVRDGSMAVKRNSESPWFSLLVVALYAIT